MRLPQTQTHSPQVSWAQVPQTQCIYIPNLIVAALIVAGLPKAGEVLRGAID